MPLVFTATDPARGVDIYIDSATGEIVEKPAGSAAAGGVTSTPGAPVPGAAAQGAPGTAPSAAAPVAAPPAGVAPPPAAVPQPTMTAADAEAWGQGAKPGDVIPAPTKAASAATPDPTATRAYRAMDMTESSAGKNIDHPRQTDPAKAYYRHKAAGRTGMMPQNILYNIEHDAKLRRDFYDTLVAPLATKDEPQLSEADADVLTNAVNASPTLDRLISAAQWEREVKAVPSDGSVDGDARQYAYHRGGPAGLAAWDEFIAAGEGQEVMAASKKPKTIYDTLTYRRIRTDLEGAPSGSAAPMTAGTGGAPAPAGFEEFVGPAPFTGPAPAAPPASLTDRLGAATGLSTNPVSDSASALRGIGAAAKGALPELGPKDAAVAALGGPGGMYAVGAKAAGQLAGKLTGNPSSGTVANAAKSAVSATSPTSLIGDAVAPAAPAQPLPAGTAPDMLPPGPPTGPQQGPTPSGATIDAPAAAGQQAAAPSPVDDLRAKFHAARAAYEKEYGGGSKPIDPERLWKSKSTGARIMSAIGLALGTFGSSITHSPNAALAIIQQAIADDLDAQKSDAATRAQNAAASWRVVESMFDEIVAMTPKGGAGDMKPPTFAAASKALGAKKAVQQFADLRKKYENLGHFSAIQSRSPGANEATGYEAEAGPALAQIIFELSGKQSNEREAARLTAMLPSARTFWETKGKGLQKFDAIQRWVQDKYEALNDASIAAYGVDLDQISAADKRKLTGESDDPNEDTKMAAEIFAGFEEAEAE